jgi:DNA-binding CsgD family transcriptional regulator
MILGRLDELERLDQQHLSVRAGRGGALALVGEAGIGKSALLDELVDRAADLTVLRSSATEVDQPLAYRTLADLLAPLWGDIRAHGGDEAEVLASAFGLQQSHDGPSDTAIGMALLEILSRASGRRAVLLVIDDAQWVDESSGLAIAFLARRVAVERVGIVVASRPPMEGVGWLRRMTRLEIGPLSVTEAPALAAAVSPAGSAALASTVVAQCWEGTGGNTLAFAELVRSLDDDERHGRREPPIEPALRGDLGQGFAVRLATLPSTTQRALAAAALTHDAPMAILERALGLLQLSSSDLQPALTAGIVTTAGGSTVFAHPLLRAAAVSLTDPTDLRVVHCALADAFAGVDDARRTWHLSSATLWPDEVIARALADLAETYGRRGALAESARAWRRSAELSPDSVLGARRFLRALQDWWLNGQTTTALEQSMSSAFRVDDAVISLQRSVIAGQALAWRGHPREGIDALRRAADDAADFPAQAAIALSIAASFMAMTDGLDNAASLSHAAAQKAAASGDALAEMAVAAVCGWHDLLLARTDTAVARLAPLDAVVEALVPVGGDSAHLVLLMAMYRVVAEQFDGAQRLLDDLRSVAARRGWKSTSEMATSILAAVHLRRGDLTAAWAITSEDRSDEAGDSPPLARAWGFGLAAQVAAALGRIDETHLLVEGARSFADQFDLPPLRAWANTAAGHLKLSRGDHESAAIDLVEADRVFGEYAVNEPGFIWWHGDLIDALICCDRTSEASDVLDRLDTIARRTERSWAHAVVFRGRGALAAADESEALYTTALRWHDQLGAPLERARTLFSRGRSRLARGDERNARADLIDAAAVFRASGAGLWTDQVEALIGASGLKPTVAAASVTALATTLSPAELRVAMAVGGGLSNREAAQQLFVSVKTVEFHLQAIYRKLNLRSRTELALAVAAERALLRTTSGAT